MNHNEIEALAKLRLDDLRYFGFKSSLLKHVEDLADKNEMYEPINIQFVPDAYTIDKENKACVIYEVENTHKISIEKLRHIHKVAWDLDYYHWDLKLIAVSHRGAAIEIELNFK